MEGKLLTSLGKIAGLGGIALGVLLLVFQGVLQKQFLPQAGLTSDQAFAIILSLLILTFGISGIGVIAWLIGRAVGPKVPMSIPAMSTLAGLMALVLGAAVYIGAQAKGAPKAGGVEASGGSIGIGGNVTGTTITIAPPAPSAK
jgi:hypothetical protein